jgi:intracellular sulfur oxidation DsrE/DsrF family protein
MHCYDSKTNPVYEHNQSMATTCPAQKNQTIKPNSVMKLLLAFILMLAMCSIHAQSNNAPVIPQADGFIAISNAKIPPDKNRVYRAIYDATKASKDSSQIIPALNMAGSELNALAVSKIPLSHAKFVIVFHGAALNGILDDEHYKAKFGITNPNLEVLSELKKAGVQLFVCGQNLIGENIDPKNISTDVSVASDALVVLMAFQNDGYALMSF